MATAGNWIVATDNRAATAECRVNAGSFGPSRRRPAKNIIEVSADGPDSENAGSDWDEGRCCDVHRARPGPHYEENKPCDIPICPLSRICINTDEASTSPTVFNDSEISTLPLARY